MATATTSRKRTKKDDNGEASTAATAQSKSPRAKSKVTVKPIDTRYFRIGIRSRHGSKIVQHNWSEKAKRQIREKQQGGKKTKDRDPRDPYAEGLAARYQTADGQWAIPVPALKKAIIGGAHKDRGIEKVLVRKGLFIWGTPGMGNNAMEMIPIEVEGPVYVFEDHVRVGQGSCDLRYRPYIMEWRAELIVELDWNTLQLKDVLTLIDWAGFGVGVCDGRPDKDGDNGRFEVDDRVTVKGMSREQAQKFRFTGTPAECELAEGVSVENPGDDSVPGDREASQEE